MEDGEKIADGYSPFTADRYLIDLPSDAPASEDADTDNRVNNMPPAEDKDKEGRS